MDREMKVYRAVKGSRLSDADAAIIGPFLEELAATTGSDVRGLTPNDIVKAARPEDSPIHRFFEWDSDKAARLYRMTEARHLANSWRIEIVYAEGDKQRTFLVPGLVNVRVTHEESTADREYVRFTDAAENPEFLAQLAREALSKLNHWQQRFSIYQTLPQFAKFAPVFEILGTLNKEAS